MIRNSRPLVRFRMRLADAEALPQLALLGVVSGLATGALILAFRVAVDLPLEAVLPAGGAEGFESLPPALRFLLPLVGALLVALLLVRLAPEARRVGVVHVLERLAYHQGQLPARNLVAQFLGGVIALASGHSIGREGPSIHLGAACSSLLGQGFRLPHNSLRILVGCGTAAAISAGFNTPLAGVIFAMEVVLLEYTIVGFVPVMVAAVSAALLTQLTLGAEPAFTVPALRVEHLGEIVYVVALGCVIGALAGGFNHLLVRVLRHAGAPLLRRFAVAGVVGGAVALLVPEVMGVGYDTVSAIINGGYAAPALLAIVAAKWLLTPLVIGLGIPGGLIGPTLFIGAAAGALLGTAAGALELLPVSDVGVYAMLGMGAMMAAVLNAPLAALVALLELTGNPNIIFPAMIAIVTANLVVRQAFGLPSAFQLSLRAQGLDYRVEPLAQALSRTGVGALMSRAVVVAPRRLHRATARTLLASAPRWVVVGGTDTPEVALAAADLAALLQVEAAAETAAERAEIDLLEIPGHRVDLRRLLVSGTLQEALDVMLRDGVAALYVVNHVDEIIGVITREQVESFYTRKAT